MIFGRRHHFPPLRADAGDRQAVPAWSLGALSDGCLYANLADVSKDPFPPHPAPLPKGEGVASAGHPGKERHAGTRRPALVAFTLLEVMIAMAIFFMAIFAILSLVSQNLQVARGLRLGEIDLGMVASEIGLTNRLEEGTVSGDFGDYYPGATWTADIFLYSSNGLYQADLTIDWPRNGLVKEQRTSLWLYRPDSVVRAGAIRR